MALVRPAGSADGVVPEAAREQEPRASRRTGERGARIVVDT
ncbi:hypothetical protein ACFY6U_30300 [Streptomyces sp. NPDC013157]